MDDYRPLAAVLAMVAVRWLDGWEKRRKARPPDIPAPITGHGWTAPTKPGRSWLLVAAVGVGLYWLVAVVASIAR